MELTKNQQVSLAYGVMAVAVVVVCIIVGVVNGSTLLGFGIGGAVVGAIAIGWALVVLTTHWGWWG